MAPSRLLCPLLSAALLSAPLVRPAAAASLAPTADSTPKDPRALYDEGKARYETMDYEGAIALWTKAYALVPQGEDGRVIRNALVYNIAQAQEKAFDIDGDLVHLKQAKGLLERYLADFEALYEPTADNKAEAQKVRDRVRELDQKIEANAPANAQTSSRANATRASRKAQAAHRNRANALLRSDPALAKQHKQGKAMLISGAVLAGVGVFGVVLGAYMARGGALASGGAVAGSGAVILIPGAILLPIGVVRFKRAKRTAWERTQVTVLPRLDRHGAGLALVGRF